MTGLENILSQIESDARQEAEEQLEAAKAQAEEASQSLLRAGEEQAQAIRSKAESAAQLERRNAMLTFKQQVIRDAIDSTRTSLESAPDQAYFDLLLQLAAKYAPAGKSEMRLNRRDLDRLPKEFAASLKRAAPQAEIVISDTPSDIASGFLLVYGGIDINCTFQAIFEDAEAELRDVAGGILFPGP